MSKRASGGGGGGGKKSKKFYVQGRGRGEMAKGCTAVKDKADLSSTLRGVLLSCESNRDDLCEREALCLLEDYLDQLYPKPAAQPGKTDLESALAAEIAETKEMAKSRFSFVNTGCKGVNFIRFLDDSHDPRLVVKKALTDVLETKVNRTKYCARMLPILSTCYAKHDNIIKMAETLLAPFFHGPDQKPLKFAIVIRKRNNSDADRDREKMIADVANLIGTDKHSVDLKNPDLTVVIEVCKTTALIAVLEDFHKLFRYNIRSCAEPPPKGNPPKPGAAAASNPDKTTSDVPDASNPDKATTDVPDASNPDKATTDVPDASNSDKPTTDVPDTTDASHTTTAGAAEGSTTSTSAS